MIVDTSALVAIALAEPSWEHLLDAVVREQCSVPMSVLVELRLATASRRDEVLALAARLIDRLDDRGAEFVEFRRDHAELANLARDLFGKGNGRGGLLNFGDLMVYAVAKQRGEAILCTGRDFASTDIAIHPASRLD